MAKLTQEEHAINKLAKQWVRVEVDPIYFIQKFCMLKDQKFGRPIPFKLWPCQEDQMWIWIENKRCISLKTRQIGISWLSAAYMLHQCITRPFFEAMVISKKEQDAIKYLDKVKFMYNHLPEFVKQLLCPLERQPTRLNMEFKNGSSAMAESSNPEAGRSETLNMIIKDECAFIPDAHSIWTAAEPTLEKTNGIAIFISTGNGYDKLFQPIWEGAENEANGFTRFFIPWSGDPARNDEWYNIKERHAEAQGRTREFRAEYPRNPVEAFIVTGETFFDPELIQKLLAKKYPAFERGNVNKGVNTITKESSVIFSKHAMGNLKLWQQPMADHHYCIGIDCAEGVDDGDNSVAAIYDRATHEQVGEYAGRTPTEEFGKIILLLAHWFNDALLNIEMNSVGDSIMNYVVKKNHYPHIYRQMRYDERSSKKIKKLGWRTTTTTKRTLIDALNAYLTEQEMHPKSMAFIEELKTFVVTKSPGGDSFRYGASGAKHDDRVIAHALCAIVFQDKPLPAPSVRKVRYDGANRLQRKIRQAGELTYGKVMK